MRRQGRTSVFRRLLSSVNRSRKKRAPIVIGMVPLQWHDLLRSHSILRESSHFVRATHGSTHVNTHHAEEIDPFTKIHAMGARLTRRAV